MKNAPPNVRFLSNILGALHGGAVNLL